MEIITLIVLALAIFIGFKKNINTGLTSIFFAFIVGSLMMDLSAESIVAGWPSDLFFMLLGMTLLFSIANVNGTLELISKKIVGMAGGNTKVLPIIFFVLTALISAPGPGTIVSTALMAPIAMALARDENIPEVLMGTMVILGSIAGGLSPLTPTGIIANSLAADQGLDTSKAVFLGALISSIMLGVIMYIIFGGYKLQNKESKIKYSEKFNSNQKKTLIIIVLVIVGILFFDLDIGLTAFSGAVLLLLMGAADNQEAIKAVPWPTLLLVCGVAVLVNVVNIAGGIDLLASFLAKIMTEKTASAVLALTSGLMSTVSSASGVVLPTLIPTIPKIIHQVEGNINPSALVTAISVGAHMVTFSPLSTLGALVLASSTSNEEEKQKLFGKLLAVGFASIAFGGLLGLIGIYDLVI